MRKQTLLLSAGLLLLLGLAAFLELRPAAPVAVSATDSQPRPPLLARMVAQGGDVLASIFAARFPVRGKVRASEADSNVLLSQDSRRVALSQAELGWLQKHAYPTDAALDALSSVDLAAPEGSLSSEAMTLRGLALLQRGAVPEAIVTLRKAAAQGAIYAYEEAAIAEYRQRVAQSGKADDADDVLRAHLEVAQILGDYKVDYLTATYLPDYRDRNPQRAEAMQRYTSEFMRQLGLGAQALGVTAPGPDPRPGGEQWRDLQRLSAAGESARVDVYVAE